MSQKGLEEISGRVALVGAGPGDPALLTLRGRELLELADIVLFDSLVSQKLRVYAQNARWIHVGKRVGQQSVTQDEINRMLIEHASAGSRVVRLKGGDPFIFGRGGEEAAALAGAKIAFEVVPGVTAAVAAAAYAGIPLTHRDFNSSVTFITGHERESAGSSDIDWSAVARMPCVAFYMGVTSLSSIAIRLVDHGMAPETPAACIQWGTTSKQRTVIATISTIADAVAAAGVGAPAVTIVGRVVSLRAQLRWFDDRPLFGKTVVVTRTRVQASVLSEKLAALGANVIEAPTIEIAPPANWAEVDEVFHSLAAGAGRHSDWIIFTSANAVEHARRRLLEIGLDARVFAGARIAVIGAPTRRAVETQLCCRVDLCPQQFFLEALADALRDADEIAGKRFLLLRADIARPVLVERLIAGGAAAVRDVAVYETKKTASLPPEVTDALAVRSVDWITFTSSSTATNLVALLGPDAPGKLLGVKLASIGPVTSQAMCSVGLTPAVEASPHDLDGLVKAMLNHERDRGNTSGEGQAEAK